MRALTPAGLLKHLRDRGESSFDELAKAFNAPVGRSRGTVPPGESPPICTCVCQLFDAGLVRVRRCVGGDTQGQAVTPSDLNVETEDGSAILVSIADARAWQRIQNALSISLTELSAKQAGNSMAVSPIFGPYSPRGVQQPEVLVLMPFTPEMALVYDEIRSVVLGCRATVARADDFHGDRFVMQDIWLAICGATLILADCTGRSPNVFYEVGLAHTVGVPTLLLTQDVNDIPFDIRHRRVIPYDLTKVRDFRLALEANIREELSPKIDPKTVKSFGPGAQPSRSS